MRKIFSRITIIIMMLGFWVMFNVAYGQKTSAQEKPAVRSKVQFVSPDGEWLLDVRESGRVPLSRAVNYYVELISLTGKPNKLIYFDWFERPQDAIAKPEPLGWSPDGKFVYLSRHIESMAPGKTSAAKYFQGWYFYGFVDRIELSEDRDKKLSRYYINPYRGSYPPGPVGYVIDIIPDQDRALWFKPPFKDRNGELILFTPSPNDPQPLSIRNFDFKSPRKLVSATLDRYKKNVAYVMRRRWLSDRVYVHDIDAASEKEIKYRSICKDALRKLNVRRPHRVQVEKTALSFDQGLFLKFTSFGSKEIVLRLLNRGPQKCFQE